MKYCQHCGFPAESDDQKFCSACGMPFEEPDAESGLIDHRATGDRKKEEPIEPPKPPFQGLIEFMNSKLGKGVLFGSGVVLLFLIGFILAQDIIPAPTPAPAPTQAPPTASPAPAPTTAPTDAPTAAPDPDPAPVSLEGLVVPGEHTAQENENLVVLRNALPDGIVTVDGVSVPFNYVGADITISRSLVPDFCIIRIIAPYGDGYATAAVCYNYNYGNDMILGSTEEDGVNNYGAYASCDISGYAAPNSSKFLDILTWDYFRFYQQAINANDTNQLKYVTSSYLGQRASDAMSEFGVEYDLKDFNVTTDPKSIHILSNPDGTAAVVINARFKGNVINNGGMTYANERYYTLRYEWEDNMWKVADSALISANDFNNSIVDGSVSS